MGGASLAGQMRGALLAGLKGPPDSASKDTSGSVGEGPEQRCQRHGKMGEGCGRGGGLPLVTPSGP